MSKEISIMLYTMQVYCNVYGTPIIIHGIVIDRDGENVYMLENGESLKDREVETIDTRRILSNYWSGEDLTEKAERMIDSLALAFNMSEVKPVYTKYAVYQRYGGPEEGGWYYDNYLPVEELDSMPDWEAIDKDRAHVYHEEFYYGQHAYTEKQHYE